MDSIDMDRIWTKRAAEGKRRRKRKRKKRNEKANLF